MKKISLSNIFKPVTSIFKSLSLVIFIVIVAGGLMYSIITLNDILQQPPSNSAKTSNVNSVLDQTTVNRLNKYKTSDENSANQSLPSGRINPFSE